MSADGSLRSTSRLRALWRKLRDVRALAPLIRVGDRALWAKTIRTAGVVDADFYAAQRGWRSGSERRAVRDYVRSGFRRGLSLNPLVDELVAGRELPEPWRVPALYAYLVSDRATVRLHPWWDSADFSGSRDSGDARGPLERAWAGGDGASLRLRLGALTLSLALGDFRQLAIRAAHEWHREDSAVPAGVDSEDPSVLWLVQRQDRDYDVRLRTAAELSGDARTVVGFVDADASQWVSFAILKHLVPNLHGVLVFGDRTYGEVVADLVPCLGTGTFVVVEPAVALSADRVQRLWREAAPGTMVSPVQLRSDGTVGAFGASRIGVYGIYRLLGGHPVEDLQTFSTRAVDVPLLTGRTFAMTCGDFARAVQRHGAPATLDLEGLSEAHTSRDAEARLRVVADVLCARFDPDFAFKKTESLKAVHSAGPDSTEAAAHILERAGFKVLGWQRKQGVPSPRLEWIRPHEDALRWSIKICAPAGPSGDVWGDRHFARGLSSALRREGQFAVVDSFDAKDRATNNLDDVTVVVRGPYQIDPPTGGVRIEWIISHPDHVTPEELGKFDRVFAASERWSEKITRQGRHRVEPLLECTDTDLFHPRGLPRSDDIVFVGTARGIARPSVVTPLAAGIPVKVYGPDWRTYIPAAAIAATSIPNEELSARYETASIVLNDQWPAMKREGFMAMRPFDVVAAGGRVISEKVDGIEEIFGGAVVTYRDGAHLVELLKRDPRDLFPGQAALTKISAGIRRDHSFDARARVLIRAAQDERQTRFNAGPAGENQATQ